MTCISIWAMALLGPMGRAPKRKPNGPAEDGKAAAPIPPKSSSTNQLTPLPAPAIERAMAAAEEEATAAGNLGGDKLVLRGMQFHGFHGVKQEEKKLGQKFVVDVDAWADLAAAGDSDDISDTVSYTDIYRIAKGVIEGPPHNLLESVAQSIASSTLLKFPQISAVRVKVGKPHVAVQGVVDYLGVEILRYRKA